MISQMRFFLPTLVESFTASYPEAMIMKKPILTSDYQFSRTVCLDSALYFNPYNPIDIVSKITHIVTSKDLQEELVKHLFSHMKLDKDVSKNNIGVESDHISPQVLIKSMHLLLDSAQGKDLDTEQKNNLANKLILNASHLMPEYFNKTFNKEFFKIRQKLNTPNIKSLKDVFSHSYFTDPLKSFLTTSKISRMPEEYNPLQINMARKLLTPMGEGGVEDETAITESEKSIHPSQLGFVDPIVSPEGAKSGIVLAVTTNAYVDDNGEPAIKVINAKTGKEEIVPIKELWSKKVAYPTTLNRAKKEGIGVRIGYKEDVVKSIKDADYIIPHTADIHTDSTKMLPLLNSMDTMRATMAQKHSQQAQSLVHREIPAVSTLDSGNREHTQVIAEKTNQIIKSPIDGVVNKVTEDEIVINGKKIKLTKDLPLARKTYVSFYPTVKEGQKVKKGQIIAESNYTKDGHLALGTHLRTAWMSMPGNRNDAIVISETAAKKLTSLHMYKEAIDIKKEDILDLKKAKALFPMTLAKFDLSKYDENGVIKPGVEVGPNEPLVIKLVPNNDKPLTKLEKTLFKPFKIKIESWNHDKPGQVVSVKKSGGTYRIFVKTIAEAKVGDKLSGRYGNKGVISKILPDDQMPRNEKGEPVHVVFTSAGVISRTNPGQLIEGTLGKVSKKTGKRYVIPMYGKEDNLKFAEEEAKKHGIEQYETLINPETGKPFPQKVFVGEPYILKLFKDSESGMSATSTDKVDINEQPGKGGKRSASSISNMEVNALLAHNAKDYLREVRTIKGQKNDAFFEAFRRGEPLPKPAENFAYEKFKALLEQLNVKVHDTPSEFKVLPLTDKEVLERGKQEVKNPETVNVTDGSPRQGGLFDPKIFGELGNRYAHIKLAAPIINPIYSKELAFLLGKTEKKLNEELAQPNGVSNLIKEIEGINIDKKLKELKEINKTTNDETLKDKNIKLIKFLEKVKTINKPLKDIVINRTLTVIPPAYRPVIKDHTGKFGVSDLNLHYQDVIKINEALKEAIKNNLDEKTINELKLELQHAIGALYGLNKSHNPQIANKNVKGILDIIGGDRPKTSYAQKALLRKNQFMSGRAVIIPSRGDLKLDEVELPEDMGLKIYEPHITREMSKMGYTPAQTKKMIEEKDPRVMKVLHDLGKRIPVIYNRAPSLWKHNIIGAYPKFVPGHSISVPPMVERALAGDFDGDQIAVHVPLTQKAIDDVKNKILASKQLFTDQGTLTKKDLLMITDQDAIIGAYKASVPSKKKPVRVNSIEELKRLIQQGVINYNDPVIIG